MKEKYEELKNIDKRYILCRYVDDENEVVGISSDTDLEEAF